MIPLIGLAHGSRDPRAGVAIAALMAEVARRRPGLITAPAFLDLTEPDLTTALAELVHQHGVTEVVALPLLFTQAFHARIDTPQAIAEAAAATGVTVRTAEILGMGTDVLNALAVRADEAGIAADRPLALVAVGSSDEEANQAVVDLAARWSARREAVVTACFATAGEPKVGPVVTGLGDGGAVSPLFLAPGLLLNVIDRYAGPAGYPVAEPLGTLLTDLVLRRYDEAVTG